VVLTYEFQLTEVIGVTHTAEARLTELAQPTKTPTPPGGGPATATPLRTSTPLPPGQTPTLTRTPTRTATNPPLPSPTQGEPYPIETPFPTVIWDTPTPYP